MKTRQIFNEDNPVSAYTFEAMFTKSSDVAASAALYTTSDTLSRAAVTELQRMQETLRKRDDRQVCRLLVCTGVRT